MFFPQHLRIAQGKGSPYLSTYTPERTKLGISVERKTNASYSSIGIVFIVMSCLVGNIRQRGFKFLSVKSLSEFDGTGIRSQSLIQLLSISSVRRTGFLRCLIE